MEDLKVASRNVRLAIQRLSTGRTWGPGELLNASARERLLMHTGVRRELGQAAAKAQGEARQRLIGEGRVAGAINRGEHRNLRESIAGKSEGYVSERRNRMEDLLEDKQQDLVLRGKAFLRQHRARSGATGGVLVPLKRQQRTEPRLVPTGEYSDGGTAIMTPIPKSASLALLRSYGPPNEWSGGIAGALGPERRASIAKTWKGLSPEQRAGVMRTFHEKMQKRLRG